MMKGSRAAPSITSRIEGGRNEKNIEIAECFVKGNR